MSTQPINFDSPEAVHQAYINTMQNEVRVRNQGLHQAWVNYFYTSFLPNLSAHPEQTHDPSPPPPSYRYDEASDAIVQDGPPVATIPPFDRPRIVNSAPILGPGSTNMGSNSVTSGNLQQVQSNPLAGLEINALLLQLLTAILGRIK